VPLSTFLCIDLTSNWKLPITVPSISTFLTYKLLNSLRSHTLRAHFTTPYRCTSSALKLTYRTTFTRIVPVVIRCYFCDKKHLLRFAFYHTSPEVHLNIRLTVSNYTRLQWFLQEFLKVFSTVFQFSVSAIVFASLFSAFER
jgi:hypothetical protein